MRSTLLCLTSLALATGAVVLTAPSASAATPNPLYVVSCAATEVVVLSEGTPPDAGCQLGPMLGALGV